MNPALTNTTGPWDRFRVLPRYLCMIRGDSAAVYHDRVEQFLKQDGWYVEREYPVTYTRGNGHSVNGRIDLIARKKGLTMALELDNRSPRAKSIVKLGAMPSEWLTGILLRNPK